MLYGVTPSDTLTLASIVGLLIVSVLLASWIPARRAASVDPANALRS
jgi:ABC-type lipoprotein release transport system permease subunit